MTEDDILSLRRVQRPKCRYRKTHGWHCCNYAATVHEGLPYCRTHARILRKQAEAVSEKAPMKPTLTSSEIKFAKVMTRLIKAGYGDDAMYLLQIGRRAALLFGSQKHDS